jgi:hypothetical protein
LLQCAAFIEKSELTTGGSLPRSPFPSFPNATIASDADRDLLQRLQEYLVWAGRYNLPKDATRYAATHRLRTLRSTDRTAIAELFERLETLLHDRATQSV